MLLYQLILTSCSSISWCCELYLFGILEVVVWSSSRIICWINAYRFFPTQPQPTDGIPTGILFTTSTLQPSPLFTTPLYTSMNPFVTLTFVKLIVPNLSGIAHYCQSLPSCAKLLFYPNSKILTFKVANFWVVRS